MRLLRLLLLALPIWLLATPAGAGPEQQRLIREASASFERFASDPELPWIRDNLPDARAVLIIPSLYRGGLLIGGAGGRGVLIARDPDTGAWSEPAFYIVASGTLGLQIGGEVSETLIFAMSDKAFESMLGTNFRVGGAVGYSAGPIGEGSAAKIADIVGYSRSKGVYAGASLEGLMFRASDDWNTVHYGRSATATDILVRGKVSNPENAELRAALDRATGGKINHR